MQVLGTVQGDCNPLDRLMLWGIVTPLTLADGDCNPKASSRLAGIYIHPLGYTVLHVDESMITLTMLCN